MKVEKSNHTQDTISLTPSVYQLHVSRSARQRYRFDEQLFGFDGQVIFADFHAVRLFVKKINAQRDLVRFPEQAVSAGEINALGLIDEIFHLIIQRYREQHLPDAFALAMDWAARNIGDEKVDRVLKLFVEQFPPSQVWSGELTVDEYLSGSTETGGGEKRSNRQIILEEIVLLWLANVNPACAPYLELFDDQPLREDSDYLRLMDALKEFFDLQPPFGPKGQPLVKMLRSPAKAVPHSLSGQLEYIRIHWGYLLGEYLYRLLKSLDWIKEEQKIALSTQGVVEPYEYHWLEKEAENFSPDRDWMPNLVLLAKNTYVWLDQLSKKYQREINQLDQIPLEELKQIAEWGFNGLWLIGLWERSPASRKIKQLRGKEDAVASAYSIFSYEIAQDLGGEEAFQALRERAWHYGIRLASDMVPNHMGIDSRWVVEHPEWFIQLPYSPFPSYSFNGPNLSWHEGFGIFIEDHYYDNSDAAVVFKWENYRNGEVRFIYHGNDGTAMPWNDTAQLNYLIPEVRESVIQAILHVARMFPIIRFDAAMTLTKQHYQRLWFPEPGSGGDIPSRSEYGLSKAEFDRLFPKEFWREVVDRVAAEQPDTLLLAEAFWLMEGYFVRTLGMHRVYNSAFMNMLRDEKNQGYRQVIKNTLEFDPQILKRFVNFMNNPDERTAVEQYGKGDKYFGICTMMVTMPGLPMFGHGQIEGFSEKYGMEFRRAYWDEQPDLELVERHKREIFPLLKRRALFAEVDNFLLYDFYTQEGMADENVFAYSNRMGEERCLVVYHNRFASTEGWIRVSTQFLENNPGGGQPQLTRKTLGEGLALPQDERAFVIFRDHLAGLHYLQSCHKLHRQGLFLHLDAYRCHVFVDFQLVWDDGDKPYSQLESVLNGRGVPDIGEALNEIVLQAVQESFAQVCDPDFTAQLLDCVDRASDKDDQAGLDELLDSFKDKLLRFYQGCREHIQGHGDERILARRAIDDIKATLRLWKAHDLSDAEFNAFLESSALPVFQEQGVLWMLMLLQIVFRYLSGVQDGIVNPEISRTWLDSWFLGRKIIQILVSRGIQANQAERAVELLRAGLSINMQSIVGEKRSSLKHLVEGWLSEPAVQRFLGVHRFQDMLWFNREAFQSWLVWVFYLCVMEDSNDADAEASLSATFNRPYHLMKTLQAAMQQSEYQVEKLLNLLETK